MVITGTEKQGLFTVFCQDYQGGCEVIQDRMLADDALALCLQLNDEQEKWTGVFYTTDVNDLDLR